LKYTIAEKQSKVLRSKEVVKAKKLLTKTIKEHKRAVKHLTKVTKQVKKATKKASTSAMVVDGSLQLVMSKTITPADHHKTLHKHIKNQNKKTTVVVKEKKC